MKPINKHRVPAKIEYVKYGKEDHGILTCYIGLDCDGYHQAFGGISLDGEDAKTRKHSDHGYEFAVEICDLFKVPRPTNRSVGLVEDYLQKIVGLPCFALYNWGYHNESICGLEVNGQRFVVHAWRRKYWTKHSRSALEEKKESLRSDIAWAKRRMQESQDALLSVADGYVDWEKM